MRLPGVEENDKPKRRPIPDQVLWMEVELTPSDDARANCGGPLRRIGSDVTEEMEYVPGRRIAHSLPHPRRQDHKCR
jgi:transposase